MKSITLSENELAFIRKHYESELEEVEKYVARVKEVLLKLKASKQTDVETTLPVEVKVGKKRGRKPGNKVAVEKPAPKKRGRKPKTTVAELSAVIESLLVEAPKKRGRKAKGVTTGIPKKRGRKPKNVSEALKTLPETDSTKFGLDDSKPGKKKVKKRSRRKRGSPIFGKKVSLAPMAKPVTLKEAEVEAPLLTLPVVPMEPAE